MQIIDNVLSIGGDVIHLVNAAFLFVCFLGSEVTNYFVKVAVFAASVAGFGFEFSVFAAFLSTRRNFDSNTGMGFGSGLLIGAISSISLLRQLPIVDSFESLIGLAIIFLAIFAIAKVFFNLAHRNDPDAFCYRPS